MSHPDRAWSIGQQPATRSGRHARAKTLVAAALVAACQLGVACSAGPTPSAGAGSTISGDVLVGNPENKMGITNSDASRAETWVYGAIPLCIRKGHRGPVRLDRVELRDAEGMDLVRAGVRVHRADEEGIAAWPGPLPARYQRIDQLDFDVPCGDRHAGAEIALEVRRTGSSSGQMSGFAIIYDTRVGQRSLTYDVQIALCVDKVLPLCAE